MLPMLTFVQNRGNTTFYEWRTGKVPTVVERPVAEEAPPDTVTADTVGLTLLHFVYLSGSCNGNSLSVDGRGKNSSRCFVCLFLSSKFPLSPSELCYSVYILNSDCHSYKTHFFYKILCNAASGLTWQLCSCRK